MCLLICFCAELPPAAATAASNAAWDASEGVLEPEASPSLPLLGVGHGVEAPSDLSALCGEPSPAEEPLEGLRTGVGRPSIMEGEFACVSAGLETEGTAGTASTSVSSVGLVDAAVSTVLT